jgi:hypothetical protein
MTLVKRLGPTREWRGHETDFPINQNASSTFKTCDNYVCEGYIDIRTVSGNQSGPIRESNSVLQGPKGTPRRLQPGQSKAINKWPQGVSRRTRVTLDAITWLAFARFDICMLRALLTLLPQNSCPCGYRYLAQFKKCEVSSCNGLTNRSAVSLCNARPLSLPLLPSRLPSLLPSLMSNSLTPLVALIDHLTLHLTLPCITCADPMMITLIVIESLMLQTKCSECQAPFCEPSSVSSQSRSHSLFHTLFHSVTVSLTQCLTLPFSKTLTHYFTQAFTQTLTH